VNTTANFFDLGGKPEGGGQKGFGKGIEKKARLALFFSLKERLGSQGGRRSDGKVRGGRASLNTPIRNKVRRNQIKLEMVASRT